MPQAQAQRLRSKIAAVAANPTGRHSFARPLTGRPGGRIRQGDWRAVYVIDADELVVRQVAHRREIYR